MGAIKEAKAHNELLPCPNCGCPDELELDSSSAAATGWIECCACQHSMQARCDEETLVERWNKLNRRDMPVFTPPVDAPVRAVPAQEASLRLSLDYWYARAKAAEAKLVALAITDEMIQRALLAPYGSYSVCSFIPLKSPTNIHELMRAALTAALEGK